MPDWYPDVAMLARAAHYLNMDALTLLERPDKDVWIAWATTASLAEENAIVIRQNNANRKA